MYKRQVQGTSIGVTSDFDGNYSISASQGDVLVFSYVGYESQTVTVGTSSTVNVSLTSSTALEEVVVTGITSRERQRLTSNAVVVGSELIEGVAVTSPDQALMGRVAGLRIVGLSGLLVHLSKFVFVEKVLFQDLTLLYS